MTCFDIFRKGPIQMAYFDPAFGLSHLIGISCPSREVIFHFFFSFGAGHKISHIFAFLGRNNLIYHFCHFEVVTYRKYIMAPFGKHKKFAYFWYFSGKRYAPCQWHFLAILWQVAYMLHILTLPGYLPY